MTGLTWDDAWDAEPRRASKPFGKPWKLVLEPVNRLRKPWKLVTLPVNHLDLKFFWSPTVWEGCAISRQRWGGGAGQRPHQCPTDPARLAPLPLFPPPPSPSPPPPQVGMAGSMQRQLDVDQAKHLARMRRELKGALRAAPPGSSPASLLRAAVAAEERQAAAATGVPEQ